MQKKTGMAKTKIAMAIMLGVEFRTLNEFLSLLDAAASKSQTDYFSKVVSRRVVVSISIKPFC
jgi:hypothetical protein